MLTQKNACFPLYKDESDSVIFIINNVGKKSEIHGVIFKESKMEVNEVYNNVHRCHLLTVWTGVFIQITGSKRAGET